MVRYLFQRVVRNEKQWKQPTIGRLGRTGHGGYLQAEGFAHEDWNFQKDLSADGLVHGYIYYEPKKTTGPFNIAFATYEAGDGWSLVGYYRNAAFVKSGANYSVAIINRRATELTRLHEAGSLRDVYGKNPLPRIVKMLNDTKHVYRWSVHPDDVHYLQQPHRLGKSRTRGFGAYFTRPTEIDENTWNSVLKDVQSSVDRQPEDDYYDGGDIEFPEGSLVEKRHKSRERSVALVKLAKSRFLQRHGRLYCEACDFDFASKYGSAGHHFIEAHHVLAVSDMEEGAKTKVDDLAMVCSNCHRMLHRRRPWLSISGLRKIIRK